MAEIKVLVQVEGDDVYITPQGLPFKVKRKAYEKLMGETGTNVYIREMRPEEYNSLTALASYAR
jgi:hypothetical protein